MQTASQLPTRYGFVRSGCFVQFKLSDGRYTVEGCFGITNENTLGRRLWLSGDQCAWDLWTNYGVFIPAVAQNFSRLITQFIASGDTVKQFAVD